MPLTGLRPVKVIMLLRARPGFRKSGLSGQAGPTVKYYENPPREDEVLTRLDFHSNFTVKTPSMPWPGGP